MKGITSHVMVIIFSLIIMVVLLVIGVGFVQNYTNIPFEKLWELTPQSGIATEPGFGGGFHGGTAKNIKTEKFFTTGLPYSDLSEIACSIGTYIFKDFKQYGYMARPGDFLYGFPITNSNTKKAIFINAGSFLYRNTQYPAATYGSTGGVTTGTDTKQNDNVFAAASQDYKGCHICREPELIGTLLAASVPLVGGIKDLDEMCINAQLRDRNISSSYFCGGSPYIQYVNGRNPPRDGTFNIPGGGDVQFGNCIMGKTTTDNNNNLIQAGATGKKWSDFSNGYVSGLGIVWNCGNEQIDFCDNSQDRIAWMAEKNKTVNNWEAIEDGNLFNDNKLVDGRSYIYGVYWSPDDKQYAIVFVLIPDENNIPIDPDGFYQIDEDHGNYFGGDNFRSNILGNRYIEARTSAIFNVTLTSNLSIISLRGIIANNDNLGDNIEKVDFSLTEPNVQSISQDWNHCDVQTSYFTSFVKSEFKSSKIKLWTDATSDSNGQLDVGTYRVVIRNWMGLYKFPGTYVGKECYRDYERSVSIYKIS